MILFHAQMLDQMSATIRARLHSLQIAVRLLTPVCVVLLCAPAMGADLGRDCCADLEARIAELETTAVRDSHRKFSLSISGTVGEGLLIWDDGVQHKAYVTDSPAASRPRFRYTGSAMLDPGWTTGYLLEIGLRANRADTVSQRPVFARRLGDPLPTNGAPPSASELVGGGADGVGSRETDVRHSVWWIENKHSGRIWIGHTSDAADGITELNLANTGHFASPQIQDYVNGFQLRNPNTSLGLQFSNLWNGLRAGANPGDGDRYDVIKYDSPEIAGFKGSASWGEADQWGLALRYAGTFSDYKLAAGIAYSTSSDGYAINSATHLPQNGTRGCAKIIGPSASGHGTSCSEVGLSASIMHSPTGLYFYGAYGIKNDANREEISGLKAVAIHRDDEFYYLQGGIEQNFVSAGRSTLFGEFFNGTYGPINGTPVAADTTVESAARSCDSAYSGRNGTGGTNGGFGGTGYLSFTGCVGYLTRANVSMWGVGFNQRIDAAAMDVYVVYRDFSATAFDSTGHHSNFGGFRFVSTGAVIKF